MAVIGGVNCAFAHDGTTFAAGLGWSASESATATRQAHSGTDLALESYDGIVDWTGTCTGIGVEPPMFPGTDFTFLGSIDQVLGVTGPARCTGMQVVVDYEASVPVMWTLDIAMQGGALVRGAAAAEDTSVTLPVVPKAFPAATVMTASVAESPDYAALPNITKFTISMKEAAGTYSSSDTGLTTGRTPGNLDITATLEGAVQNGAGKGYLDWPDTDEILHVRAFVNQTKYWGVNWLRFTGYNPGAQASDNVLRVSLPAVLAASQSAGTASLGFVDTPGGTRIWGPA